jgi:DNA-binding NtrC family response regulator
MKILVVDDEQVVLNSCKRVLEAEGFEVCLVPSAEKALEALEREGFGLLLIDIKMPEHDGLYLIQEVKERWPAIPMIVMSGYDTAETIEEAARVGAAIFIAKPFTPDELVGTVCQVVSKEEDHETDESPGHR